ncbi:MAG: DNA gyrase subunit A [candidate division WOR-3 bacterium]|nr:DNA gyrase subunit A [candidate division WOR-3 bacterium]
MKENNNREEIIKVYIEDEVKKSYLDYAMSVIVGRALPDVRDGLKPVQRRILYSMYELGLTHNRPYKKSATVVGDVLGKYHPHGDAAVYDTLVRMAQDFSLRYPLIDGQGNFGSIDGDAPAAYRYTEARLSELAEELLKDLDKDTVDFAPNFDGRLKEPKVLPAAFPNLLVNGASGIAVGMATNIPPHNFGEVIDALCALIDDPDLEVTDLMKYIQGPDFPTGGVIVGKEGITEAYKTGRGKIVIRGKYRIEEGRGGKDKIIITEIPYMVNKTSLIERIATLVREKKITDVTDLRDESDRDGMRIVLELKRDANPEVVINQLYKFTPMQETFGVILLVLVDNVPKILNLKELLQAYLDFRYETVVRRTKYELKQAEDRAHILEGLKIALKNIDKVIAIIKSSKDPQVAKDQLMKKFSLTEIQAQAILDMKLVRLTNLEQKKIDEEYLELIKLIARLKGLLASKKAMLSAIKDELLSLKERFADKRKTEISKGKVEELNIEDLIAEENVAIMITHRGYIKRMPVSAYRRQSRGGVGRAGVEVSEEDFVEGLITATTLDYLLFFTNQGRCYWLKVYEIPEGTYQAKGRPIVNLIELEKDEKITSYLSVREFTKNNYVFMVTAQGIVKKTSLEEFSNPRKSGIIAINIEKNDRLINTFLTSGKDEIVLVTKNGMGLRFSEKDVRAMGRNAYGVTGIKLAKNDEVIDGSVVLPNQSLLIVTELGYGKRCDYKEFPLRHRGGKGVTAGKVNNKSGKLISAKAVSDDDEVMIITKNGTVLRIKVNEIRKQSRATVGVRLIQLREGDCVVDVARIVQE